MIVRWDTLRTGWPSRLDWPRIVSAFSRPDRVANFKIGICGDPGERARAYEGTYDEMVALYETGAERFVRDTERFLTDYYWDVCDNSIRGGGGRLSEPPYYLYIVLRRW